jgi:GMP synthase (glutamine-hydrolysing)
VLLYGAIGEQLQSMFVNHGLLRKDEAAEVVRLFRGGYNIRWSTPTRRSCS